MRPAAPCHRARRTHRTHRTHRARAVTAVVAGMLTFALAFAASTATVGSAQDAPAPGQPAPAKADPGARAAALADAEHLVGADGDLFPISPDWSLLAAVESWDGGLQVVDLRDGVPVETPRAGEACVSAAFAPDGSALLAGTDDGRVLRWDLPGRVFAGEHTPADGHSIDGLSVSSAGLLGWSDRTARVGGVWDPGTGRAVRRWTGVTSAAFGGDPRPRVTFTADGSRALFHARENGERGDGLVVWNLREGRAEASLPVYVAKETPGWAEVRGGIAYGTREGGDYQVRLYEPGADEERVLDPDARNLHFIDLLASPDGTRLAEGDFEDRGVRILDVTGESEPRTLAADDRNTVPVGWDADAGLLFTTAGPHGGVAVWNADTGERLAEVAWAADRRVTRARARGDRLLIEWWDTGEDDRVRRHMAVLRVPEAGGD